MKSDANKTTDSRLEAVAEDTHDNMEKLPHAVNAG
jgi:hypothetical protein